MSAQRPSYMLAPNWDFPPDGAIALGNLIKDPKHPEKALYHGKVDPTIVTTTTRSGWSFTRGDARSGRVGLWASVLAPITGISGDAAVNASRDSEDVFKCDELETRYFVPDDPFLVRALTDNIATEYTSRNWWKSVYMITGLKIAHRATMETKHGHAHGGEGKVGVDGTSVGAPVTVGPELQYQHKTESSIKFDTNNSFVLAYQLLRLKPKKEGPPKTNDYNKFAQLDDTNPSEADKTRAGEQLHRLWDIEGLTHPPDEEEWDGVEAAPDEKLDCTLLVATT